MKWITPFSLKKRGILGMNRRNVEYIGPYNPRRFFPRVDNKLTTKLLATDARIAIPKLIGIVETQHAIENVDTMLGDMRQFVAKPAHGSGGKGILVITNKVEDKYQKASGDLISLEDIKRHLTNTISGLHSLGGRPDIAFFEELVTVDPLFHPLSFEGVPDIRLIVFRGFPIMGMLRLATKSSDGKANLHQGAIGVGLDIATGQAIQAVQHDQLILKHPDTGADLTQIQIPDWHNLLTLAAQCYGITGLGYMGCDIVIDKNHGPLILELNARPGLSIQIANNTGLLHRLRHVQKIDSRYMTVDDKVNYSLDTISKINQAEPKARRFRKKSKQN